MTITAADMIDYLQQFPGDTPLALDEQPEGCDDCVILSNAFAEFADGTGHFDDAPPADRPAA